MGWSEANEQPSGGRKRCVLFRPLAGGRRGPGWMILSLLLSGVCSAQTSPAAGHRVCIIITGLGGMPEYAENFQQWADRIENTFQDHSDGRVYRLDGSRETKTKMIELFQSVAAEASPEEFWLFLIGHANHDGQQYKFNIAGPDLTGQDIETFLEALGERRTFLIAATSASGTLVSSLSRKNRVIVTATRNQFERQPPLFMSFFLEAIDSGQADIDKDGRISLLEAFHFAFQQVGHWYQQKGRLQTEHPQLDDSGRLRLSRENPPDQADSLQRGTLLASLAYLSAPPEQSYRSAEAERLAAQAQVVRRDIEDLKFRKHQFPEAEYYDHLEQLLLRLAEINQKIGDEEGQR